MGWANVQKLLQDGVFWLTVRNTLLYLLGVVPVLTLVPLVLAILVNPIPARHPLAAGGLLFASGSVDGGSRARLALALC